MWPFKKSYSPNRDPLGQDSSRCSFSSGVYSQDYCSSTGSCSQMPTVSYQDQRLLPKSVDIDESQKERMDNLKRLSQPYSAPSIIPSALNRQRSFLMPSIVSKLPPYPGIFLSR